MTARGTAAIALASVAVLGAGGAATAAKKKITPKPGSYQGKVTNDNGKGSVRLTYGTFSLNGGHDTKAVNLTQWRGVVRCADGSTREDGGNIIAPLKGRKFSGGRKTSGLKLSLKGRFTSSTKMTGTARMILTGPVPAQQCDTGPVTFRASRASG